MKQKNLIFLPKGKWTRMLLSMVLLMVLTTGMAFAQQKTITGKVTDKSGSSIPGASIVVKGTATGTVTDGEGKYSLKVASNTDVLLFSFIGMKSATEPINGRAVINVVLEDEVVAVGEVVAIGYGTQTKREISGSVTNVSAKDFNRGVNTNAADLLKGKVAGLTINSGSGDVADGSKNSIRLRGTLL